MPVARRICLLGHHELDYPRNVVSQRLIRRAGFEIDVVHSRAGGALREAELLRGYARVMRRTDAVFVTEGSHRHVPWVKAAAAIARRPVIFDAFTSRYNTWVEDRKRYAKGSPGAARAWLQDWAAIRCSDLHVYDTAEHRDYFRARYGTNGRDHVIEVGVDEEVFASDGSFARGDAADGELRVLFYGTYIPLQGVEHIVGAAALLRDERSIRFTLIGRGQTRAQVESALAREGLDRVVLEEPVSPRELVARMRSSDVCLGIFGDTEKAGNVVPNKVVQAAAVARPIVTRRSTAVARYFEDGRDALLVDAASPRALADAILWLRDDAERRRSLAERGRRVFEGSFSERALTEKMRAVLDAATSGQ